MTGSFGQSPGSASQPEGKHRAAEPATHSYNLQRPRGKTTGGRGSATTAASHGYQLQSPKQVDPAEPTTMTAAPHGYTLQPPEQTTVDDSATSVFTSAPRSTGTHGYQLKAPQPTPAPAPSHTYGQLPTAPPVPAYQPPVYQPPAQKPQDRLVTGAAPYSVGAAISGGFRRLNKNPLPWLTLMIIPIGIASLFYLGLILFPFALTVTSSETTRTIVAVALIYLPYVVFAVAPIAYLISTIGTCRGALEEMDLQKPKFRDFFRSTRWAKLIGTWIVIFIMYLTTLIPWILCIVLGAALIGAEPTQSFTSITYEPVSPETIWIVVILTFGVGPLTTILLSSWFAPKARLMPLITVDNNVGAFRAFGTARRLVRGRFWSIYVTIILTGFFRIIGILLCYFICIYTFPLARLIEAHMYRQLSEGARPMPADRPTSNSHPAPPIAVHY